jgi:formylglycine-generating enzyme required for sulfatase activity
MDVDRLRATQRFSEVLDHHIQASAVMLVLIGKAWLEARDEAGNRRLDDTKDWVHIEIAAALKHGVRLVPVLVDGADAPSAEQLPPGLRPLMEWQAIRIRHDRFNADAGALVRDLREHMPLGRQGWVTRAAMGIGSAAVAGFALLSLAPEAPESPPEPTKQPSVPQTQPPPQVRTFRPGDRWVGPRSAYPMRYVPPTGPEGFTMGSPPGESEETDEQQHTVVLTRGYWVGEVEVSQALWTRHLPLPDGFPECADWEGNSVAGAGLPMVCVSWCDAIAFANALSAADHLRPAYPRGCDDAGRVSWDRGAPGYRLLTEAEWERAARGDQPGAFGSAIQPSSVCALGNIADGSLKDVIPAGYSWSTEACHDGFGLTAPVDSSVFPTNGFGLQHVVGNVREWTWDIYGAYPIGTSTNPEGPLRGANASPRRVNRGGGWNSPADRARVANRTSGAPSSRIALLGLRLTRSE